LAQVNLVVGDYFGNQKDFIPWTKQATELIGWLCGKSLVLAMLRKVREEAGLPALSVLRAVLTRWTAQYMAYRHFLELHTALVGVIAADEMQADPGKKMFITGDAKACAKAKEMVRIVKDPVFWHTLAQ
jgi:hypothetical protein